MDLRFSKIILNIISTLLVADPRTQWTPVYDVMPLFPSPVYQGKLKGFVSRDQTGMEPSRLILWKVLQSVATWT